MSARFHAVLPSAEKPEQYELVAANILARTLVQLEGTLSSRVAPRGTLLLSGIWGEEQARTVIDAFSPAFSEFDTSWQDGWALVSARRKAE
jgi:ribosomal protein L11 methylase PrmA